MYTASPLEMWLAGPYKPRSSSSKPEMAPCHFPVLRSDPEKCGRGTSPRTAPASAVPAAPARKRDASCRASSSTGCWAAVKDHCSAEKFSRLGTTGGVENNLQPDSRDGKGKGSQAKVTIFSQRKETRWINTGSSGSKTGIRLQTRSEGEQEKWHWMNGTTFTKLQKEHFEISVALGTFILSAAATSETNIYKSVYNSKGSLGVCSYSNKL